MTMRQTHAILLGQLLDADPELREQLRDSEDWRSRLPYAAKARNSQSWDAGEFVRHRLISIIRCSQFCACQSTQKPQGSTGFGWDIVNHSIEITYFRQISTGYNNRRDLFWEQRVGGSNPSAPTSIFKNSWHVSI
jgi:hypothetical protein